MSAMESVARGQVQSQQAYPSCLLADLEVIPGHGGCIVLAFLKSLQHFLISGQCAVCQCAHSGPKDVFFQNWLARCGGHGLRPDVVAEMAELVP